MNRMTTQSSLLIIKSIMMLSFITLFFSTALIEKAISKKENVELQLIAIGDVSDSMMQHIADFCQDTFNLTVRIMPPLAISQQPRTVTM